MFPVLVIVFLISITRPVVWQVQHDGARVHLLLFKKNAFQTVKMAPINLLEIPEFKLQMQVSILIRAHWKLFSPA